MEIQTSIVASPIVEHVGMELPQPFPRSGASADRRKHFPAFQSAALCRDAATGNNLKLFADVPAITHLEPEPCKKA